ncbi:MAG: TIGR00725 family protein, partial [Candidatus Tectomicrobia bacterium RIFCSPLOWO2_12_FULL_69_37]
MKTLIAVIGDSVPSAETAALAEEVGRRIAERGAVLVCGGLGGVMEAAARGAKSAGGLTLGILPGYDPASANPYIDLPICTGMGHARNVIIAATAGALIALEGAYGTLSEIA